MSKFKILASTRNKLRIGILGGTFNPAHEGHRYISLEVLKRLDLNFVIWLVTPQNPQKALNVKDNLQERKEIAISVAHSKKIIVSDIEQYFKSNFTADSLSQIKKLYPSCELFWIMGADNMVKLHTWHNWKKIFQYTKIVVIDREDFFYKTVTCKAALNYPSHIVRNYVKNTQANEKSWIYFKIKKKNISSSMIRGLINNGTQKQKKQK